MHVSKLGLRVEGLLCKGPGMGPQNKSDQGLRFGV